MSFKEESQIEGQWKNLTNDVLAVILKRLDTRVDLCRFRCICKTWRLFASPLQSHLLFPITLPSLNPNSGKFLLSPSVVYVFSPKDKEGVPASQRQRVWLAAAAETGENEWSFLNPLTKGKLYFSSGDFKKRINLLDFRNLEVGRSYRLQVLGNSEEESTFGFEDFSSSISVRKVVVNIVDDKISVLGLYNSGEIAIWNMGDDSWKIVQIGDKKENQFDDVICYDGKFFAVDKRGRLVMINITSFEFEEVVTPMEECQGMLRYIYLVEANFKLYMVNKTVNPRPSNYYDEEEEEWVIDKTSAGKPLGFDVYALNEKEKSWEKVKSLGDKVLFVSRDATFSVCATDLGWNKGNCVYFEGLIGYDDEADVKFGLNAGVYTLEDCVISTFDVLPSGWTDMFWPPSTWFPRTDDYPEYEMQH